MNMNVYSYIAAGFAGASISAGWWKSAVIWAIVAILARAAHELIRGAKW